VCYQFQCGGPGVVEREKKKPACTKQDLWQKRGGEMGEGRRKSLENRVGVSAAARYAAYPSKEEQVLLQGRECKTD